MSSQRAIVARSIHQPTRAATIAAAIRPIADLPIRAMGTRVGTRATGATRPTAAPSIRPLVTGATCAMVEVRATAATRPTAAPSRHRLHRAATIVVTRATTVARLSVNRFIRRRAGVAVSATGFHRRGVTIAVRLAAGKVRAVVRSPDGEARLVGSASARAAIVVAAVRA